MKMRLRIRSASAALLAPLFLGIVLIVLWWRGAALPEEETTFIGEAPVSALDLTPSKVNSKVPVESAFQQWLQHFRALPQQEREAILADGIEVAKARMDYLRELIERDPEAALRASLSFEARRDLPDALLPFVERSIHAAGSYDVSVTCLDSRVPGGVTTRLAEVDGELFKVFTYGQRLETMSKETISIHGIAIDGLMALNNRPARKVSETELADRGLVSALPVVEVRGRLYQAEDASALDRLNEILLEGEHEPGHKMAEGYVALDAGRVAGVAAFEDGSETRVPPPDPVEDDVTANSHLEGLRTILYIRVRFSDDAVDYEPVSLADAQSRQAVVHDYMEAASYGKMTMSTVFTDVIDLPQTYAYYSANGGVLRTDARTLAQQADPVNWDYANYDHYTYVSRSGFGYGGLASIGGPWSHLVPSGTQPGVAAHEYGHNLGLGHSNYWLTDSPSPIGRDSLGGGYVGDAPEDERITYGHIFDCMGAAGNSDSAAGRGHYSASNKTHIHWLEEADGDIAVVTASTPTPVRLYRLDPTVPDLPALQSGVARGIQVDVATDDYATPGANSRRYWLNYRMLPEDGDAEEWLPYGLQVDWSRTNSTIFLDMTPFSRDAPSSDTNDKRDGVLLVGKTYSDAVADIHITPVGIGGTRPNEWIDVVVHVGTQVANVAPVITDFSVSMTEVTVGASVDLAIVASDNDGDDLAYGWDFGDASIDATQLNEASVTKSWTNAGFYTVRGIVSDMKGGTAVRSVVVKVGDPTDQAEIRGVVLQSGTPVESARVSSDTGHQAWTGSDGGYVLPGLAPGVHEVSASKLHLTLTPQFHNPVFANASLPAAGMDFHAQEVLAGTADRLALVPSAAVLPAGVSLPFELHRWDASGILMAASPVWSVSGGGAIDAGGVFAAAEVGGPFQVTGTEGGLTATAEVTVVAINDVVSVRTLDAEGAESDADPLVFRLERSGAAAGDLTVLLSNAGTATEGLDYDDVSDALVIPDGDAFVDVTVTPIDDGREESEETVILQVVADAAYSVLPAASQAVGNIADNDVGPVVQVNSPASLRVGVPLEQSLVVSGTASDADGLPDPLFAYWYAGYSMDGSAEVIGGTEGVASVRFPGAGAYDLTFWGSDGANSDSESVHVFVGVEELDSPLEDSQVVELNFEEALNDTVAVDSVGGDNSGTLEGAATRTSIDGGIAGRALLLNGDVGGVRIPNNAVLNVGGRNLHTISVWFQCDNLYTNSKQVIYKQGGNSRGLCIYLDFGRLYVGGWNNNENGWDETYFYEDLWDNGWHHVVLVLDASSGNALQSGALRGYLDGGLFGSGDAARLNQHTAAVAVGARLGDCRFHDGNNGGDGDYFQGRIDEVKVWTRALTANEIAWLAVRGQVAPKITLAAGATSNQDVLFLPSDTGLILDATPGPAATGFDAVQLFGESASILEREPGSLRTAVRFPQPDTYWLDLRVTDGIHTSAQTFQVRTGVDSYEPPHPGELVVRHSFDADDFGVAVDESGNAHDGAFMNSAAWTAAGLAEGGVQFTGGSDHVLMGEGPEINEGSDYTKKTICLWFKADPTPAGEFEVLYEQGGGNRGLSIYLDGDTLHVLGRNDDLHGWSQTDLTTTIQRDVWHHVAMVLDVEPGSTELDFFGFQMYLDGALVDWGEAAPMAVHADAVALGAVFQHTRFHDDSTASSGNGFVGVVDEFLHYNDRALTSEEIFNLRALRNIAPKVMAGLDQPEAIALDLNLAAAVIDDGRPAAPVTTSWSLALAPLGGSAAFSLPDGNGIPTRATLSADGVYTLRLTASDGEVTTFDDLRVSASDGPTFDGWIGGYFDLVEGERVATANTDNDPFSQFYEYATGGNPLADDDPLVLGPGSGVTDDTGSDYFELTYRRRRDHVARNLIYEVEFSETLAPDSWDSAMGTEVRVDPVNAEIERVTVRFSTAIGGLNTHQFARLSIREGP